MKNSRQNALRWIRDAENTLRVAEMNCQWEAYNVACFLAEQAAQKSLKGVLYLDGARFIRIHSIAELIKQVSQKRPEFLPFRGDAGTLDQYYLTTRYPDAVAEPAIPSEIFTKKQAEEAVRIARSIFELSKSLMS
ncbi:MAG: HEPN domain-containing protein [Terriglobia bacterium]